MNAPKFEIGDCVKYIHEYGFIVKRSLILVESRGGFIEIWVYKTSLDTTLFIREEHLTKYTRKEMRDLINSRIKEYQKTCESNLDIWTENLKKNNKKAFENLSPIYLSNMEYDNKRLQERIKCEIEEYEKIFRLIPCETADPLGNEEN